MSTPESKVKAKVKTILKEANAYFFMPATYGYGASGVSDIVCCINGRFVGIECKAGRGEPTNLQKKNLGEIVSHGGIAIIVNEGGVGALRMVVEAVCASSMSMLYDLRYGNGD
jgi:Holliday junction resolvase